MQFLVRVLINGAALWLASLILDGVYLAEGPGVPTSTKITTILVVALLFGLLNALVRPVLKLLSLPLIVLTLGLFTFVLNAIVLYLLSWLAGKLDLAFTIRSFWWEAVLCALLVSLASWAISLAVPDRWEGKSNGRLRAARRERRAVRRG